MIERYSLSPMSGLFTDQARLALWLEVEVLAVEAWASLGVVPIEDAKGVRERAPAVTPEFLAAVQEREKVTDHDLAAFVDVVQQAIGGPAAAWVHYGLTSSDVVDTALGATLARAADLLIDASDGLVAALKAQALAYRDTAMVGRTHGMHAEPTTFGHKLALWCLQADRDRSRLRAAREAIAVGKVSGAVGTYSNIDPAVEAQVCAGLGLQPVPASQVVARDRHAEYLYACASVGASIEQFATEIRHLARTEVGEVEEPFRTGQKGSSAMPHKRNPILAERLAGLARVLRGNLGAGLEDVALWHERDISHSSVERVILPDSSLLAYYLMVKMRGIVEGMQVHPGRMLENLDRSYGLVFSQPVLLALIDSGLARDDAYRVVQEAARTAWTERRPLREVLGQDARVSVPASALDEAFSLDNALRNVGLVFDALEDVN